MTVINVQFIVYKADNSAIENGEVYAIRREIALTFENSEFGRVEEIPNTDRFRNTFITPTVDDYSNASNDLVQLYQIDLNDHRGNLTFLLLQMIPNLHRTLETQYHTIVTTRVVYN